MNKYVLRGSVDIEVWAEDVNDAAQTAKDKFDAIENIELTSIHGCMQESQSTNRN